MRADEVHLSYHPDITEIKRDVTTEIWWVLETLDQDQYVLKHKPVHEWEKLKRDESEFVVRGIISKNEFCSPLLNSFKTGNILYEVGSPNSMKVH